MAPRLELGVNAGPFDPQDKSGYTSLAPAVDLAIRAEMSRALRRYGDFDWEVPAGGWEE
jgi:hypothetical protein